MSTQKKKTSYLPILFRDLLVVYTSTTYPCRFSLCSTFVNLQLKGKYRPASRVK